MFALVGVMLLPDLTSAQCEPNWTQRSPATAPSPRYVPAMAYDSARGVIVLFGGWDGSNSLGDTWKWDGSNWGQETPSKAPTPRWGHGMTFDSARGLTVLFGGYNDSVWSDTWEYDGVSPLQLLQQPVDTTVVGGSDAVFGVAVAGTGNLDASYQWRKNGTPIPGASGPDKAFLRIPSASRADAGSYDCAVTAGDCQLVSNAATLTVNWRSDFDNDDDVDLMDFGFFRACFNGPNRPPSWLCPG